MFMFSSWFLQAFVCTQVQQYVVAIELYRQAVEILEWGRQKWNDVPSKERGSMFDLTYIRAVKRMYITALIEVCKFPKLRKFTTHLPVPIRQAYDAQGKSNSQFKLEDAVKLANEIIADVKANPPAPDIKGPANWGALLSFWAYPAADAHAVLGYYHMQAGLRQETNVAEARKHFAEAANHYLKSAGTFPKDDEKHPCESGCRLRWHFVYSRNRGADFLSIAVKAFWHRRAPLRLTLPLCERVREGLSNAEYLWGYWANIYKTNRGCIDHCLQFQEHWKKEVADGKVTMDYEAKPAVRLEEILVFICQTHA
jgi:tetratricopeptide (TPR) repeat protein